MSGPKRDPQHRDPEDEGGYGHPERYTRDLDQDDEHVADRGPRRAEDGPPEAERWDRGGPPAGPGPP